MASHGQHCSHGPKSTVKNSGSSLPLQPIFQNRIFQNYLNCIEKGQKEHTKCFMISNPTPKFTSQIRSIWSVFGRNRTGTGSEKIDRIDRNRISGRTLVLNIKDSTTPQQITIAYGQNHVSNRLMCDSLQFAVICISILFKLKRLNIKPN